MPIKNFDQPLKNRDGSDHVENGTTILMKTVIVNALDANPPKQLTGVQKHERSKIAQQVYDGGDIDLKPEQIVLIKEAIEPFGPFVLGQIYDYLDA